MAAALDDFRWQIVQCSAHGAASAPASFWLNTDGRLWIWTSLLCDTRLHRPAKVADLEFALQAEQQVLWLDIAMDDSFAMQIKEGICHLCDVLAWCVSGAHVCQIFIMLVPTCAATSSGKLPCACNSL